MRGSYSVIIFDIPCSRWKISKHLLVPLPPVQRGTPHCSHLKWVYTRHPFFVFVLSLWHWKHTLYLYSSFRTSLCWTLRSSTALAASRWMLYKSKLFECSIGKRSLLVQDPPCDAFSRTNPERRNQKYKFLQHGKPKCLLCYTLDYAYGNILLYTSKIESTHHIHRFPPYFLIY